jgi:hypothetical protein
MGLLKASTRTRREVSRPRVAKCLFSSFDLGGDRDAPVNAARRTGRIREFESLASPKAEVF